MTIKKYIGLGILAVLAMISSCTSIDDTLGSNLILPDQKMEVRVDTIGIDPAQHILTRMIYDDTIKAFNPGRVFLGQYEDPTMGGTTWAGFATTFKPVILSDSIEIGYKPAIDSIKLIAKFKSITGNDMLYQFFDGYALNSDISMVADTMYYVNFPYENHIDSSEPLFRFRRRRLPTIKDNQDTINIVLTQEGQIYFGNVLANEDIYDNDTLFYESFKGLVITPNNGDNGFVTENGITSIDLASSYIGVYYHNYESETSNAVKDTLQMWFTLDDSQNAYETPNKSIGMIRHDYSESVIDGLYNTDLAQTTTYVQGFAGVTTQLEFQDALFAAIDGLRAKAAIEAGVDSCDIVINQAVAYIELEEHSAEVMDAAPKRLGMYSDFREYVGIPDYDYNSEMSMDSYTGELTATNNLAYDGNLNRSLGVYKMNITTFIQHEYQNYMNGKSSERSRITLAPTVYNPSLLFEHTSVALKGSEGSPIKLKLTYTIIYDGE